MRTYAMPRAAVRQNWRVPIVTSALRSSRRVGILGLLGVALAGRWRSMVLTFGAALAIVILYGVSFGFGAGLNSRGYPAAYGTWTANAAFLVIAVRLLRSRSSTTTTVSV